MKSILTIGGKGLVGSRVTELLADKYQFTDMSRATGLDITNAEQVSGAIKNSDAEVVILFAAKADVEGCEKDKEEDLEISKYANKQISKLDGGRSLEDLEKHLTKQQTAWAINVIGARNVAKACEESEKKLIYISTDFVFGKEEPKEGGFGETDIPHPVNWYGQTKYEGEKIVQRLTTPWLILRIAYPYRAKFDAKKDFARVFLSLLQQGKSLSLITDHKNNPTFIDDISMGVDTLLQTNVTGIYHVTGSQTLTPYEEGIKVAEVFGLDKGLIGQTTREEFFKDRAPRPFSLAMNNAKITELGARMRTFEEGLGEVRRQMGE